jgi:hypothetical protein
MPLLLQNLWPSCTTNEVGYVQAVTTSSVREEGLHHCDEQNSCVAEEHLSL